MRSFYLDANNESGSDAILTELNIQVNKNILNIDSSHVPEYTLGNLTSNRQHDVYKEKKSVKHHITFQSHIEGFYIDVRDKADCWLRVCLEPFQSLAIPPGLYFRLYTDVTHNISFLTHTYKGKAVETCLRYPEARDAMYTIPSPHKFRELTCELCRQFYECGWVTGTGGSISIRYGNRIYMTPSGVQKERIQPDEVFLMDISGKVLSFPPQKVANKVPKLTDCSPLFFHAYRLRNAGAVIHSHDITCVLASALFPDSSEYRISRQEMIKGIAGHGYLDELVIPIIENTPKESELADSLSFAIKQYPKSSAVLVRDHGIYVWGESWEAAKKHSECLHYLFNVSIQMYNVGIHRVPQAPEPMSQCCVRTTTSSDTSSDSAASSDDAMSRKRKLLALSSSERENDEDSVGAGVGGACDLSTAKFVLLDIEGTTTPITFVKDVLFPYSSRHLQQHLADTLDAPITQAIIASLIEQHQLDVVESVFEGNIVLDYHPNGSVVLDTVVSYARALIAADRKIPALKQLQGLIWKRGYTDGDLHAVVYEDVKPFLTRMKERKVPVCIYSSGSRGAQQLLFKYTNDGDLRPLLNAYFDTTVGQKRVAASYQEILLTLGCTDRPQDVVFVTDVVDEAVAAQEAGMRAVISDRPGNAPLPSDHGFSVVTSFDQLE